MLDNNEHSLDFAYQNDYRMKNKKWSYLLVLLTLFFAHSAYAESSVWKVVKGENQLFIGGTVHMLSESDYPLPPEFEKAYSQSEKLVFEADMQQTKTEQFKKEVEKRMFYADGRNLKRVLNEATYQKLEQHLSDRGIPIANLMKMKAGMVAGILVVIEMQRLGFLREGVDEFFRSKALSDRKELGALETVQEQLDFLANMGEGHEDEIVVDTLRDIDKIPETMKSSKDAWRRGDNSKLAEIFVTPMKRDFPKLYDDLVVKRNNAWVPKIETMLETEETEFVLFGALHLVGDDGVLAQLAARGYEIQKTLLED